MRSLYGIDPTNLPKENITKILRDHRNAKVNTQVLGVSIDSHFTHLAWINTPRVDGGLGKIEYPLLADINKEMARDYNVLVETPGDDLFGAALRGLFIIDMHGQIKMM